MPDEIIIKAGQAEKNYWRDLWRFRELFYILSWRDIKVRYKQTVIGAAWSIVRPVLTTVIFTIVFSRVAKLPNNSAAPYALMVYAGMLPWQFFSNALSDRIGQNRLRTLTRHDRRVIRLNINGQKGHIILILGSRKPTNKQILGKFLDRHIVVQPSDRDDVSLLAVIRLNFTKRRIDGPFSGAAQDFGLVYDVGIFFKVRNIVNIRGVRR